MKPTDRGTVITLALTIAATLTLAACQGDAQITPSPTATLATASAQAPPPAFGTEVLVKRHTDVADVTLTPAGANNALAAGILADQRTVRGTDSDGKSTYATAVMDDGTVVGGQSGSTSQATSGDTISHTAVGVSDASGTFTHFADAGTSALQSKGVDPSIARQAYSFHTRGRVVAWAETSSTNVSADNWVIVAHDLDTGTTSVLGASNELVPDGHLPGIGPDAAPSIGTSRVFWGTTYPLEPQAAGGASGYEILAAPLDGTSAPAVIAKGALLPAADGDCVAFARGWGADASVPRGEITLARVCGDGPKTPLARLTVGADGGIGNLVADGDRIAWSTVRKEGQVEGHREVTVLDLATGALTSVNLSATPETSAHPVAEMSLDGDLLQWTTDGSHMVLDLNDNSLWSLPASEGLYVVYAAQGWVGLAGGRRGSRGPRVGHVRALVTLRRRRQTRPTYMSANTTEWDSGLYVKTGRTPRPASAAPTSSKNCASGSKLVVNRVDRPSHVSVHFSAITT